MSGTSERPAFDYYTTDELEALVSPAAEHISELQQIQQAAQERLERAARMRQLKMADAGTNEQEAEAQATYDAECRKIALVATRCALIEHDRFANTRAAALLEATHEEEA